MWRRNLAAAVDESWQGRQKGSPFVVLRHGKEKEWWGGHSELSPQLRDNSSARRDSVGRPPQHLSASLTAWEVRQFQHYA